MKNVSKVKLEAMPIPRVPVSAQGEFAARAEQVNAQRELVEKALAADDELFASLQARAFRGEL